MIGVIVEPGYCRYLFMGLKPIYITQSYCRLNQLSEKGTILSAVTGAHHALIKKANENTVTILRIVGESSEGCDLFTIDNSLVSGAILAAESELIELTAAPIIQLSP